jgi:hypothetical protein
MAILSVSNRKGYLSFLVDEISYRDDDFIIFPCRDELIIKILRECLDDLYIGSTIQEDKIGRPLVCIKEIDAMVKMCFSLANFRKRAEYENILRLSNQIIDSSSINDGDIDLGWASALMDLKTKVYNLPKPRLLIRSNKGYLITRMSEILDKLEILYKVFDSSSYQSISIGKREAIRRAHDLIPTNLRLNSDIGSLVNSFNKGGRPT